MSVSALESVRSSFRGDLEAITVANGYRNTVKNVYEDIGIESTEFPSMTLVFTPDLTVDPVDSSDWSVYEINVPFAIICEIASDTSTGEISNLIAQQDSLIHDVLKVIASNYKDNILGTPPWNIRGDQKIKVTPIYPTGDTKGIFSISGSIQIRHLDSSFT